MNTLHEKQMRALYPLEGVLRADLVWRFRAVPIGREDGCIVVAIEDPVDSFVLQRLGDIMGTEIRPEVVTTPELEAVMSRFYGSGEVAGKRLRQVDFSVAQHLAEDEDAH